MVIKSHKKDYYLILQVQPDAPVEVIRDNYKMLLKKLRMHPDLGGQTREAALINIAYEILSHPKKRLKYDQIYFEQNHLIMHSRYYHYFKYPTNPSEQFFPFTSRNNQRNYYRILQAHPNAHPIIIEKRYKTLLSQSDLDCDLLHQAFWTLTDPEKKHEYDRLLKIHKHIIAIKIMQARWNKLTKDTQFKRTSRTENLAYLPNQSTEKISGISDISSQNEIVFSCQGSNIRYCAFCKTAYCSNLQNDYKALCAVCNSPLFSSKFDMPNKYTRYLRRIEKSENIVFYTGWPGRKMSGCLWNISPTGLCFCTAFALNTGQVIKIDGKNFKAIAKIIHGQINSNISSYGARFYTLFFNSPKGNFLIRKI